jgi:hypothetical protein
MPQILCLLKPIKIIPLKKCFGPYCTIGWVDIGTRTKVLLRFVTYLTKATKINKKVFSPSDRFIVGQNILGHALYRGSKIFFFHNMDFMAAEFYVDFKNINLP